MSSLDRFIRLVRYLKPYRVRLGAAFVCSALVAALSGAYAWLVKPVLDEIFINKNETLLLVLPLALFAVSVLKSAFSYGQNYLMNYVGNQVITDIRQELFGKLVRLPVQYHDANTSGRLVSRVINDVTLMANAIAGVLKDVFQQGLTFLAMLGVIFYQNWKLGGMSIIVIPLAVVTMMRMGKRLRALGKSGQEQMGDMASTLQETLSGIRMVKAYGREEAEAERFKESNKAFLSTTMKAIQVSSLGFLPHRGDRGGRCGGDHLVRRLARDQRRHDAGSVFFLPRGDVYGVYAAPPALRFEQYHSTGVGGGRAGLQRDRSRNRAGH